MYNHYTNKIQRRDHLKPAINSVPISDSTLGKKFTLTTHHEENTPQEWTIASRDKAEPGIIKREQDDANPYSWEQRAMQACAVRCRGTLDPEPHGILHAVQKYQSESPPLYFDKDQ